MAKIHVKSWMRSFHQDAEETFIRFYGADGALYEQRITSQEVDYDSGLFTRCSTDNGKTWGEWEKTYKDDEGGRHAAVAGSKEGDELVGLTGEEIFANKTGRGNAPLYDPNTGCSLALFTKQYFIDGHNVGYFAMWEKGEDNVRSHAYFALKRPDGTVTTKLLELEEGGADFDPQNPRNPAYLDKNRCAASDPRMLSDGSIVFFCMPSMRLCCKMAGVDVNTWFPSCPDMQHGILLGRLTWNEEKQDYDVSYSAPVMLSDLQSSRGIMEPLMEELPDGRLLLVVRASNDVIPQWNTRISRSAPGYKWYSISNDGGRTFPPLMPWHFDNREVVCSSASISRFFRSGKNGKLYWIGNMQPGEPWRIKGNNPRWPLYICQVNEEDGCLIKDTLTVIDTVREGQTSVELSNFFLMENRETKALELLMTKINFNDNYQDNGGPDAWYSEAWEYEITFED